jgi:hypothetical protein
LLPSRLVQASADFAVPFWKGGAWWEYMNQACGELGPLLWALGFISMLAPQFARRREHGWLLTYWVVSSYVFWTIVPNRQLRFLMPGLAPLGLFMAATWPPGLTWSVVAIQLAAMANFYVGAVGPLYIPMPYMPLPMFVNRPPAREDWKIDEILRRIEAERDPTRTITNVTLVANHPYFNAPTFHWVERRLNLPHARMRGVNKRLCELSEFVLLKTGSLGPPSVIGGLPAAAKQIADPDGWFGRAYEEIARWPLPDASAGVLYRQRRGRAKPTDKSGITYDVFAAGDVKGGGMHVDLGRWDPDLSAWRIARASVGEISVRGLAVRGAAADLENFSFVTTNQYGFKQYDWDEIRLMRVDRVTVRGLQVDAEDLRVFLEKRVPGLKLDSLTLDGTVKAAGTYHGRPVAAEAALELDRAARRLKVAVLAASYMGVSVPTALFRPIKELNLSLDPNPETPFYIDLPGLTIKGGRLTIP